MIVVTTDELNDISIDELIDRGYRFTIKDSELEEDEDGLLFEECKVCET